MKSFFINIMLTLSAVISFAQKNDKGLHVGDNMPDYRFPRITQYARKTLAMKELKGKWVILDFWSTSCTSCIEFFPHMQQLQNYFGDKIRIILVNVYNRDSIQHINKIISRINKAWGYDINLPIALYDSLLVNYFPHKGVPHEIIISPAGKIQAITSADQIKKENIQALLDGKEMQFPLKDDFRNQKVPLVAYFNKENTDGILVNSSLMKYTPLVASAVMGGIFDDKDRIIGSRNDFTLIDGYRSAYPELFENSPEVKYETTDSVFKVTDRIENSKWFIYDFIVAPRDYDRSFDELYRKYLRQDLDLSFNFSLRKGKSVFPCLIVKTNDRITESYASASDEQDENLNNYHTAAKNNIPVYAHNCDIQFISSAFNRSTFHTNRVIDLSALKRNLNIDLPAGFDFSDKEKVASYLHDKGIDLSIENRELDCIIVSDKKPGEPTISN